MLAIFETNRTKSMGNNLFLHATSELSQDAFIAWLLTWADSRFEQTSPAMYRAGRRFVSALIGEEDLPFTEIEVRRQTPAGADNRKGLIDVTAELHLEETKHLILIESKIGAGEHNNQLKLYRSWAEAKMANGTYSGYSAIYLKIRNDSVFDRKADKGFKVFDRTDFISVLDESIKDGATNDILRDYLDHLKGIEERTNAFETVSVDEKGNFSFPWMAWEGLFSHLQNNGFQDAGWGYVSNARGGFRAFWWHWSPKVNGVHTYLQLEHSRLTFRVKVDDKTDSRRVRNEWHKRIKAAATDSGLSVERPGRFGSGRTMCVGEIGTYLVPGPDGKLDLDATKEVLLKAQHILDEARRID